VHKNSFSEKKPEGATDILVVAKEEGCSKRNYRVVSPGLSKGILFLQKKIFLLHSSNRGPSGYKEQERL
jgi:hypothetical protein